MCTQLLPSQLKPTPKLPDFSWANPALSFYLSKKISVLAGDRRKQSKRSSPNIYTARLILHFMAVQLEAEKVLQRPSKKNLPFPLILGLILGWGKHGQGAWLNKYLQAFSDPATALPSQTSKSLHASFINNPIHCKRWQALPRLHAGSALTSSWPSTLTWWLTQSCCLPGALSSTLHFMQRVERAMSFCSGLLFPFFISSARGGKDNWDLGSQARLQACVFPQRCRSICK